MTSSDAKLTLSDPLDLLDEGMILDYYDEARTSLTLRRTARSTSVQFAMDETAKAGFSGGCYEVRVPEAVADPTIDGLGRRQGLTLVEYLRTTFAWGGFPGFEFGGLGAAGTRRPARGPLADLKLRLGF